MREKPRARPPSFMDKPHEIGERLKEIRAAENRETPPNEAQPSGFFLGETFAEVWAQDDEAGVLLIV